jgi:hypothetical protein
MDFLRSVWQFLEQESAPVTALATIGLVLGTLFIAFLQARQHLRLNSANMLISHYQHYEFDLRPHCQRFSGLLLVAYQARSLGELPPQFLQHLSRAALPVLGFFEAIGLLTHEKVLDAEMVWGKFGWEVVRYYMAVTEPINHLEEIRRLYRYHPIYEEFEWLYRKMLKLDAQRRKCSLAVARPSESEVLDFLRQETTIDDPPPVVKG